MWFSTRNCQACFWINLPHFLCVVFSVKPFILNCDAFSPSSVFYIYPIVLRYPIISGPTSKTLNHRGVIPSLLPIVLLTMIPASVTWSPTSPSTQSILSLIARTFKFYLTCHLRYSKEPFRYHRLVILLPCNQLVRHHLVHQTHLVPVVNFVQFLHHLKLLELCL